MSSKTYKSCRCVVLNCPTNDRKPGDRGKIFSLPRNEVKRARWLELLGRSDLREKNVSRLNGSTGYGVCGLHFQNHHFVTYEKKFLNRNAEPDPNFKAPEDHMIITRSPSPSALITSPSVLSSMPTSLALDMVQTTSSALVQTTSSALVQTISPALVPTLCDMPSKRPSSDSFDLETTPDERPRTPTSEGSTDQAVNETTAKRLEVEEERIPMTQSLRCVPLENLRELQPTHLTPRKKIVITKLRKVQRTMAVMNSIMKMVNLKTGNKNSRSNEIIKKFLRSAMK